ncbi:MAG: hypothetical protein PVH87_02735 [Desulfobacteraceae bacterium]|jgi:hypothetical protein
MASGTEIWPAIAAGFASAGTCGLAFGLVVRVLFGRVARVEGQLESSNKKIEEELAKKTDVSSCDLKHDFLTRELAKGTDNFKLLQEGQKKQSELLIRLDERMGVFQEIFKSAKISVKGDDG